MMIDNGSIFFSIVVCVVVCMVLVSSVSAEDVPEVEWAEVIGTKEACETGYVAEQLDDGGFIIFGKYGHDEFSSGGVVKTRVVKLNAERETVWVSDVAAYPAYSHHAGLVASDGGYVVTGYPALTKLDHQGMVVWQREPDGVRGYVVEETSDRGYIIGGVLDDEHPVLLKTDAQGDTVWEKEYYFCDGKCVFFAVHQTTDGGYLAAVNTESFTPVFDFGITLLKTDSKGNELWRKMVGENTGDSTDSHEIGNFMELSEDGGCIIGGKIGDNCLLRIDAQGDVLWETSTGLNDDFIPHGGLVLPDDEGFVLTGSTGRYFSHDDAWLMKVDNSGREVWNTVIDIGMSEIPFSVRRANDRGFLVAGEQYRSGSWDIGMLFLKYGPEEKETVPVVHAIDFGEGFAIIRQRLMT